MRIYDAVCNEENAVTVFFVLILSVVMVLER